MLLSSLFVPAGLSYSQSLDDKLEDMINRQQISPPSRKRNSHASFKLPVTPVEAQVTDLILRPIPVPKLLTMQRPKTEKHSQLSLDFEPSLEKSTAITPAQHQGILKEGNGNVPTSDMTMADSKLTTLTTARKPVKDWSGVGGRVSTTKSLDDLLKSNEGPVVVEFARSKYSRMLITASADSLKCQLQQKGSSSSKPFAGKGSTQQR